MVRWDNSTRLLLLLKIHEQAPAFKVDFQTVCDGWPGEEKLTVRACKDQWNYLKKNGSQTPKTAPRTPGKSISVASRKLVSTSTPTLAIRNKRGSTDVSRKGSKKRKVTHNEDAIEVLDDVQTSAGEGELTDEETDEKISDDNAAASSSITRRQPRRARARSKTVIRDTLSSGDDAAKAGDTDSDFDLEKDYESKLSPAAQLERKRKRKLFQQQNSALPSQVQNTTEDEDYAFGQDSSSTIAVMGDDVSTTRENNDDDASSQATKRTSWETAATRLDDLYED